MKNAVLAIAFLLLLLCISESVSAQSKIRVRFARGATSAIVSGTVRGYAYKDYVVGASVGQEITAKLNQATSSVLTIFQPNGDNLEGATESDEFTGTLPSSGDYVIRVMMMRSEARRPRSVSNYILKISIK
jgi:hypothetical protein